MSSESPPWASVGGHEAPFQTQYSNSSSSLEPPKSEKNKNKIKGKQVGGAAIAGTIVGLVAAGPLIGVVAGVGAAAVAVTSTKAGHFARKSGDAVNAVGDQAKKINEQHQVVDKTKKVGNSVFGKAKEVDENHHVVDKTKNAASGAFRTAKNFDEKHQIVGKTGKGLSASAGFIRRTFAKKKE
mmetsp:Transcript_15711/g.20908  ORF Transcript_15711/g.20908 Transcript_15711/m.20908 type:complete len:183 (-) Transcript_15711:511-1059(-)